MKASVEILGLPDDMARALKGALEESFNKDDCDCDDSDREALVIMQNDHILKPLQDSWIIEAKSMSKEEDDLLDALEECRKIYKSKHREFWSRVESRLEEMGLWKKGDHLIVKDGCIYKKKEEKDVKES